MLVSLVIGIVLAVALLLIGRRWSAFRETKQYQQWHAQADVQPFSARQCLLSRAETSFHQALQSAVGSDALISMKVRIADLVLCDEQSWKAGFGRLIAQKHIDFVLCEPGTTRIMAAIELDDQSHAYSKRRSRDDFINQLFASTGIPLLRVRASSRYDPAQIRQQLLAAVSRRRRQHPD